jgi:CheY-like chemotaxis protein
LSGANSFKILIADDNVVNQRVLHDLLKMRGHSVRAVNNGLEVLKALESESFDLVILDCLMPGMDGYTTCRTIRAADPSRTNPAVPILAVTALASEADRRKCLEAGTNDYLSKPILAETLFDRVENLLERKGSGAGERAPASADNAATAPGAEGVDRTRQLARKIFKSLSSRLEADIVRWQSELAVHLERNAHEEIRLLAHQIRGTADLAECPQLSELSARLERAAGLRHGTEVRALAPKVSDSLERLRNMAHAKE